MHCLKGSMSQAPLLPRPVVTTLIGHGYAQLDRRWLLDDWLLLIQIFLDVSWEAFRTLAPWRARDDAWSFHHPIRYFIVSVDHNTKSHDILEGRLAKVAPASLPIRLFFWTVDKGCAI